MLSVCTTDARFAQHPFYAARRYLPTANNQQSTVAQHSTLLVSSKTFSVTGVSLPVAVVYSVSPNAAQVTGISKSADAVRALVMRIVMQTVFDVLEQQGRGAGLPDFVISSILNQLTVSITYTPLECKNVAVNPTVMVDTMTMVPTCVI
ncbi:hypothetical protein KIN20_021362 [Parelaphostrongylus tenuis]|uniref:Uncharacterized protein n=1 Tax=Parelaphostrongylus tenuis TaxID=148309 RepID=A0AAD5NAQ1_PARTN|nr:hypothetical protein KIN20_021362 [Parelaphostrongylus tenuis]